MTCGGAASTGTTAWHQPTHATNSIPNPRTRNRSHTAAALRSRRASCANASCWCTIHSYRSTEPQTVGIFRGAVATARFLSDAARGIPSAVDKLAAPGALTRTAMLPAGAFLLSAARPGLQRAPLCTSLMRLVRNSHSQPAVRAGTNSVASKRLPDPNLSADRHHLANRVPTGQKPSSHDLASIPTSRRRRSCKPMISKRVTPSSQRPLRSSEPPESGPKLASTSSRFYDSGSSEVSSTVANGNGDAVMTSRATYFVQECPTCGRSLQVRVEYLGKSVKCQHCCASFRATDPSLHGQNLEADSSDSILARVEQLLASAKPLDPAPN